MIRLDHWPMDVLIAANPGAAVSETGVIAHAVKVVFCGCCEACRPADHNCCPLQPVDGVSVAVLDRVRARTEAAPALFNGGREPA